MAQCPRGSGHQVKEAARASLLLLLLFCCCSAFLLLSYCEFGLRPTENGGGAEHAEKAAAMVEPARASGATVSPQSREPPKKAPVLVFAGQQVRQRTRAGTRRDQERFRRRDKCPESWTNGRRRQQRWQRQRQTREAPSNGREKPVAAAPDQPQAAATEATEATTAMGRAAAATTGAVAAARAAVEALMASEAAAAADPSPGDRTVQRG